jgi:two-component system CheB/CheR fusion protein
MPEIFDLFTQGERSLDRSQGGRGIGLTLVKTLVEMHGGEVSARSAGPGRGSEFVVRLPLVSEGSLDEFGVSHSDGAALGAGRQTAPARKRILVVDDNKDAADLLAELVGLWGYEVRSAYTGMAALEIAAAWHPDLAFLDLGMPGLNGYEVARRLRQAENGKATVLVAVSGYGQEEHQQLAREAGFDHHVTKPADTERLERLLERKLGAGAD